MEPTQNMPPSAPLNNSPIYGAPQPKKSKTGLVIGIIVVILILLGLLFVMLSPSTPEVTTNTAPTTQNATTTPVNNDGTITSNDASAAAIENDINALNINSLDQE